MIEVLVIDLDGPILDGQLKHYLCYSEILKAHGHAPLSIDKYWSLKRQRCQLLEQLELSGAGELRSEFLVEWRSRIEQRKYLAADRLQPGASRRLGEWRDEGLLLVLATMRNDPETLAWQLDGLGLSPMLSRIVVSGTEGGADAKWKAVNVAMPGRAPESVLWIGDTEADIQAARALGVRVLAVSCGTRTAEFLRNYNPDGIVADLNSVPAIDVVESLFPVTDPRPTEGSGTG